ncbi:CTR copper uptake transporter [Mycena floridula]|nr:CTR copper uptake transporter [Mycena floridula]
MLRLLCFISVSGIALADTNGMDMSMDGSMSLDAGTMITYLHFTTGDTLWFQGWVPRSTGAMAGACIGLFLLAIIERWVACIRATMESAWKKNRAQIAYANKMNSSSKAPSQSTAAVITLRNAPPFMLSHDIPRGILYAGQSALGFLFMLAVMTFQVGFILAIVIGLGVGETLFGRYAATHGH